MLGIYQVIENASNIDLTVDICLAQVAIFRRLLDLKVYHFGISFC